MSGETSLSRAIKHYQASLEKHSETRNDFKLLHYISKLQELPVQVHHLEETGVGRTVNGLRKLGGEVSEAAKSLVAKWKQMVLAQHEQEEEEDDEENNNNNNNSNDDDDDDGDEDDNLMIIEPNEGEHNNSSYHSDSDGVRDDGGGDGDEEEAVEDEEIEERHKTHDHTRTKHESHESHNKAEKSHKSHKHKHKDRDNHRDETKHRHHHHKEHSDKSSSSKSKSDKNHKHDKDRDRSESKEKKRHKSSKSDNRSDSKKDDKTRRDHHSKNNEKRHSSKHKSKRDGLVKATNGIDSASGASFAEALGMCEPSSSRITTTVTATKRKLTPETNKNSIVKEKIVKLAEVPKPVEEPPPDIDISSLLPPITPHYRPLGNLTLCDVSSKKTIDWDDLSTIITSKNQRTKVYSGNKTGCNKVPTLFELCVRILQDNIDALEFTGGVPYSILKPILEKATAAQLFALEHHNPYLIEETDELWQIHCQKTFRNKQPDEFESWREMFMRCSDEREAKLKALTANIKQAQDKSTPVRTTKLAYVDDVVKPPRNVLKKQAKNAIFDKTPTITPSARLSTIATSGEAGKIVVPNPGSRAAERSSSSSNHATNAKPKKAPLMMKSLSLLKNRFRR